MSELNKSFITPITPKKRASVKKQASQLWSEVPSRLSHIPPDLEKLQQAVERLQKRLASLEDEWAHFLEHLSDQEDSMGSTQEEEEMN